MQLRSVIIIGAFLYLIIMVSNLIENSFKNMGFPTTSSLMAAPNGSLSNTLIPDASFIGVNSEERIGYYLCGAGDVNGDGFDDFMVAAYHNHIQGWNSGGVYLFLGRQDLTWGLGESIDEADALFCGKNKYDLVGYNVAGGGDFNGDGFDDLLIGAPGNWESDPLVPGTLFIVLGKADIDYGKDFMLAENADISYVGENNDDQFGYAVDFIGDINHDGCDDVLCAAAYKTVGQNKWAGKVYLIFGKKDGFTRKIPVVNEAVATFVYPYEEGTLGAALTGVGDMNQDGIPDFAMCAYGAGTVFLFWGREDLNWGFDFDCRDANVIFTPEGGIGGNAGWQIKNVGDVNGDAIPDFAVSGVGLMWTKGKTYLILGRRHWDSKEISLGQVDASFIGEKSKDHSGVSINGIGDFDGDGYDDFVIGARYYSRHLPHAGKVYLIKGRASGWQRNVDLETIPDYFTVHDSIYCIGWGTAGIGDFNGDTGSDFIVSAPFYSREKSKNSGYGHWVGQIYLFLGNYPVLQLTGTTRYYGHRAPVSGVQVDVTDHTNLSKVTQNDGSYQFNLASGHAYRVTPSKPADSDLNDACITAYDAALVARHAIRYDTLRAEQLIAADVNRDGNITMYDAALILRYALDFPKRSDSFAGSWTFCPESRSFENFTMDVHEQDFTCIILGDVDSSWEASSSFSMKQSRFSKIQIPSEITASANQIVELPIVCAEPQDIVSFEVNLEYDSDCLEWVEFKKSNLTQDFTVDANLKNNVLEIGGFGTESINRTGKLLTLYFKINRKNFEGSKFVWRKIQVNNQMSRSAVTICLESCSKAEAFPDEFRIMQNYPNPFNPETLIRYQLPKAGVVHIRIHNIVGQQIRTLIASHKTAGNYALIWNGRDETGQTVANGIYFLKAVFEQNSRIIKMLKVE